MPNVLTNVKDYQHLNKVSKKLGNDLVVQTPYGDSGHTTFFINSEEDFNKYKEENKIDKTSEEEKMCVTCPECLGQEFAIYFDNTIQCADCELLIELEFEE